MGQDDTSLGSQRLASLQRAAFDPSLVDAAREELPRLRRRMLALAGNEKELTERLGAELDEIFGDLVRGLEQPEGDHVRNERLEELQRGVADAASRLGLAPLEGVVIGPLHKRSVDAFSNSFFGAANIVALHVPLMVFAYLVAKATATFALARSPLDDDVPGQPSIPIPLYQLGLRWLTQLVHAVAVDGDPIGAPAYVPPRTWPFWQLALTWLDGIEFFSVAHEYGHLVHDRDPPEQLQSLNLLRESESLADPLTREIAADRFGLMAIWKVGADESGTWLGAFGPLVFLWFLAQLESVGHIMHGEDHPAATARLTQAEDLLPSTDEAAIWKIMKERLNQAWSIAAKAAGVSR
jgi:hypothetical protein